MTAKNPNDVHIQLDFGSKPILSFVEKFEDCHPEAYYWLPQSNYQKFEFFLKLKKKTQIDSEEELSQLVKQGIIKHCPPF